MTTECRKIVTPFSKALADVKRVYDYLTPDNPKGGSRLRTIALSFPRMLQSEGLMVSISFLYSKAKGEAKPHPSLDKAAGSEATDPKTLSARYLELVVDYLDNKLPFQNREPIMVIKELAGDQQKLRTAESLLPAYVSELKMLSEALFKEEEE